MNFTTGSFDYTINLSDSEKLSLKKQFIFTKGNVNVTLSGERYFAEFSLGSYNSIHSYPVSLSEEDLGKNVERDRILWLKDIARSLSEEENLNKTNLENLSRSFNVI